MGALKKLMVIGIIVGIVLCFAAYDYIRAQDTQIELVSISPENVVADPNQAVTITLKVTAHGEVAEGDVISALLTGQGSLSGSKVKVDENGYVTFKYYPYTYVAGVFDESDVTIEFRNVSDSVFVAIQKRETINFHVGKPESTSTGGTMGDLFG